jgi:hypothetical protein
VLIVLHSLDRMLLEVLGKKTHRLEGLVGRGPWGCGGEAARGGGAARGGTGGHRGDGGGGGMGAQYSHPLLTPKLLSHDSVLGVYT